MAAHSQQLEPSSKPARTAIGRWTSNGLIISALLYGVVVTQAVLMHRSLALFTDYAYDLLLPFPLVRHENPFGS